MRNESFTVAKPLLDIVHIDPLKRFSSLPLFIRFGMLRNFFMQ